MTDLLSMVQQQLTAEGYSVEKGTDRERSILLFENDCILGFVLCFSDARALLNEWEGASQRVLHAAHFALKRADQKAWNTYVIFLTESEGDYGENIKIGAIEENLTGTRKLAKAGVSSTDNLKLALLPLCGIQNAPRLDAINMPVEIQMRTSELPLELIEAFLHGANESTLIQLLEAS